MNKPTGLTFMIGNYFSLSCAAAFIAYWLLCFVQSGIINVVALTVGAGLVSIFWKSRRRVRAFPNGNNKALARYGSASMALIVWCAAIGWVSQHPDDNYSRPFEISCLFFSIASLALLFHAADGLHRFFKRRREEQRAKPAKLEHHIVEQCLKVPASSPGIEHIKSALPGYAARCLD